MTKSGSWGILGTQVQVSKFTTNKLNNSNKEVDIIEVSNKMRLAFVVSILVGVIILASYRPEGQGDSFVDDSKSWAYSINDYQITYLAMINEAAEILPEPEPEEIESKEDFILVEYELPPDHIDTSFKAYMDYRCITDTNSMQYELQQMAYTDERGFRRIGDDYLVALGTYYTDQCGDRFLITLDSGVEFSIMIGDIKDDRHTDTSNRYLPMSDSQGNVVEFIVNTDNMESYALQLGDVSILGLEGQIVSVEKIVNTN